METFVLKDGTEAQIETWGYNELEDYVATHGKSGKNKMVKGFRFLSDVAVQNLLYRGNPIFAGKNLSPMEKQELSGLTKESYANSIAALSDDELMGIMVCNWVRDSNYKDIADLIKNPLPFWRYFIEFLSVREDCQNKGVGTAIIEYLDDSQFLKNKILQLSVYNDNGSVYARPVIEKKLHARTYALIPHDYSIANPPTKPGVYDKFGRLKK